MTYFKRDEDKEDTKKLFYLFYSLWKSATAFKLTHFNTRSKYVVLVLNDALPTIFICWVRNPNENSIKFHCDCTEIKIRILTIQLIK